MASHWRIGGFEGRLLVFFLILSVTPTLLVAIFGTRYFAGYVDRLSNVALRESFHNSMEIARQLSSRLDHDALTASGQIAEAYWRQYGSQSGRLPQDIEGFLETQVAQIDADFAALYALGDSGWELTASYPPNASRLDSLISLDLVSADLSPRRLLFSDQDVVASALRLSPDLALVSGYTLEPGMIDMMRRTGEDYSRYSSVGLYVSVIRRYTLIVISALVAIMAISSAVASRLLARRISHPIRQLAQATERIARGDLEHRVNITAKDEIQSLVTAFNNMTEDLQEYKRNLIRAERLAGWRGAARRIAHEIRNAITPITNSANTLKILIGDVHENRDIGRSLDSILAEIRKLKNMAQEFSLFAKLPEPRLQALDLNGEVASVLGLYSTAFGEIEVATQLATGLPPVLADPDQLRTVLSNLMKNAAEAMAAGGRLTIRTSGLGPDGPATPAGPANATAPMLRIEIADTGPGIPRDIRDRIFDPDVTTKSRGTGLGLALVQRIVQDHGGRITFKTGPEGTTFMVDLKAALDRTEEAI